MCWAWTGEHDLPCTVDVCTPSFGSFAMTRTCARGVYLTFLLEVDRMYIIMMAMPLAARLRTARVSLR